MRTTTYDLPYFKDLGEILDADMIKSIGRGDYIAIESRWTYKVVLWDKTVFYCDDSFDIVRKINAYARYLKDDDKTVVES